MMGNLLHRVVLFYFFFITFKISPVKSIGVIANFSLEYKAVPEDEIVTLQSAIEDDGYIDSMPVRPIVLKSADVPERAQNVTATALDSTRIKVVWSKVIVMPYQNFTIAGYAVYYKEWGTDESTWEGRTVYGAGVVEMVVEYLRPYTLYTFRVLAFHDQGNGISSNYVDERTKEGIPSKAPEQFQCTQESSSSISLTWNLLDAGSWNGIENGYEIEYNKYGEKNSTTKKYSSDTRQVSLDGLSPFTRYEIYIRARTQVGPGPREWCVQNTQEGVPSVGPVIYQYFIDGDRPLEAEVKWHPIPDDQINGFLIGYKFTYGYSKIGRDAIEYPDMKEVLLDKFTTSYVLKNLLTYSETKIEIYGRTSVGHGKASNPAFVETCKCPKYIYNAWFENKPYVTKKSENEVSGIFPDYLTGMLKFLCSDCKGYSSQMYWDRSKTGHSPKRQDERDLKKMVSDNVHLHVAMFGRSEIETFQSDYKYVSIVASPGIAWVVRDPEAELDKTAAIMTSLASCWPAVIIIVLFSMVAGIFIWIADCQENKEDFPDESYIKGLYHGTYWAFVSMTTVGYGDKTPRSFMAQIIAICWMLMGPIINGIVVGAITTSLTSINLEDDPKIYGSKVAAINNSFEYNLGVRRNAKLNETGKFYTTTNEMIDDLANRFVDGILVDSLVAADMADKLSEKKMKIAKLIPEPSGWGIILSGEMLRMEEEIRSYVANNEETVKKMVENATDGKLTIKKVELEQDTGLIDKDSEEFKNFVKYGLLAYGILCILGLAFEHGFLRMRRRKVVPYSEEHRKILEEDLAVMITDFCEEISEMINEKSGFHERELKRLFWKKGYSFGVDGWLREKTNNEEELKNKIRYSEIMSKDLGLFDSKANKAIEKWKKGKKAAANAMGVGPIRVAPIKETFQHEKLQEETMA